MFFIFFHCPANIILLNKILPIFDKYLPFLYLAASNDACYIERKMSKCCEANIIYEL